MLLFICGLSQVQCFIQSSNKLRLHVYAHNGGKSWLILCIYCTFFGNAQETTAALSLSRHPKDQQLKQSAVFAENCTSTPLLFH